MTEFLYFLWLNSICVSVLLVLVAQACPTLCNPMDRLLCPWNSPGKNVGVDSYSLLQGLFTTQESNPGLLHCRQILYRLSHQRSSYWIRVRTWEFMPTSLKPRIKLAMWPWAIPLYLWVCRSLICCAWVVMPFLLTIKWQGNLEAIFKSHRERWLDYQIYLSL